MGLVITLGSGGGTYDLYDGPATALALSELGVDTQQVVEQSRKPGAQDVEFFPRGNISSRLHFTISRLHDTAADATVFALTHFGYIPLTVGPITFNFDSGAQIVTTTGVIESAQLIQQTGKRTVFAYTLLGGLLLSS